MDNVEFVIDSLIEWCVEDWKTSNYIDVEELTKPVFWRRLMNCRVDKKPMLVTFTLLLKRCFRREGKKQ